jgi:hypothetical protein
LARVSWAVSTWRGFAVSARWKWLPSRLRVRKARRFVDEVGVNRSSADYREQLSDPGNRSPTAPRRSNYPTFEDGLRQLHIIEAVLRSSGKKAWMEVGQPDLLELDRSRQREADH